MPTAECKATLAEIANCMFTTVSDKISGVISGAAILTPIWHTSLREASETSSLIFPILGCLWLVVQIISKIGEVHARKRAEHDEDCE